jgi:hypothetical protein
MPKFRVTLEQEVTDTLVAYVEVEADNEDDAADIALECARQGKAGEWVAKYEAGYDESAIEVGAVDEIDP